jgi:hypothetical protein
VRFGAVQIVDSVHVVADVNVEKDDRRRKEGGLPWDRDACWGAKGDKVVVGKDGNKEKKAEYFYGYKDQVSLNADAEMITSFKAGCGDEYDEPYLPYLVGKDLKKGIEVGTVASDRGYDDGENHYYLEGKGINSAINQNRTELALQENRF